MNPSTMDAKYACEFQAVILAGGQGNRMASLTQSFPKALLPVANRPLLAYQLAMLHNAGVTDVTVLTKPSMKGAIDKFLNKAKSQQGNSSTMAAAAQNVRVVVAPADAIGSADSLRACRDQLNITKDFFLVSSDVITNIPLHNLAAQHRLHRATMTMMLQAPTAGEVAAAAAGGDAADDADDDDVDAQFIGLDEQGGRLLFVRAKTDVEEEGVGVRLPKAVLRRFPRVGLFSQLRDAHIHVFSPRLFDWLEQHPRASSLQGEVVPFLVASQFVPKEQGAFATGGAGGDDHDGECGGDGPEHSTVVPATGSGSVGGSTLVSPLSGKAGTLNISTAPAAPAAANGAGGPISAACAGAGAGAGAGADACGGNDSGSGCGGEEEPWWQLASHSAPAIDVATGAIRCYAVVAPGTTLLARCDTVASLRTLSQQLVKRAANADTAAADPWTPVTEGCARAECKRAVPTCNIGETCVVGAGTQVAPATVRNSMVGAHCRIGKGCRLDNCVLMDHVSLEDGVVLVDCVVGAEASIEAKTSMKKCTVAPGMRVATGSYEGVEMRDEDADEE